VPRVLIGDFGSVLRLGLKDLLDEEGLDVVAESSVSLGTLDRLIESLPDIVVVDLDAGGELAARIAHDFPAVKVIACSSVEPLMRVFPPFHRGESYVSELDPESFVAAIRTKG